MTLQACGYQVLAATPEQLQRLTQQRRVFASCGGSVVVRRADGFLETHATLAAMLECQSALNQGSDAISMAVIGLLL
ncbi:hypothetical protein RQ832_09290 [Roseomonas sp. DSM 102946]|nr:hypothetical protein [Roseomonas sp. DSM 102946]